MQIRLFAYTGMPLPALPNVAKLRRMKHQLDFEKPIAELQSKLEELKNIRRNSIRWVSPLKKRWPPSIRRSTIFCWQMLFEPQRPGPVIKKIARHPKRPFTLDYLESTFTAFSELHGDRLFAEDRAVVGGFACLGPHRVLVLGTQKGRDTKENILRNFGSAHPEGYRKALRLMRLADKFKLPIITLIDTAGAYPGIGAEERHIAEAIAVNLREMMLLEGAHHRRSHREGVVRE